MCGLVTLLNLENNTPACTQETLDAMTDRLAHRGPDGRGTIMLANGRVALGHRRLAIVDLDYAANQPFSDPSRRATIVFNGEIYNHRQLRAELEQKGITFATDHSDTEVIVQGYLHWGFEALLSRLEGMFAFVIWDQEKQSFYAARDRIGVKPLYYTVQDNILIFTSEIKALQVLPNFNPKMNDFALIHMLSVLATPAPMTLFDGVFKLAPGHMISWSKESGLKKKQYWKASRERQSQLSGQPLREATMAHLKRAVTSRLAEDVDTGVFLSGGVDSSLILGIASQERSGLNAYTVGFEGDSPYNEFESARHVANLFGANMHEIRVNETDALNYLDKLILDQDEPIADWVCVPLHFVSQLAQSNNSKVVLVGEGADELFAGYPGWHGFLYQSLLWRLPALASKIGIGRAVSTIIRIAGKLLPKQFLGLIGLSDGLAATARGESRFWTGAMAFSPLQRLRVLRSDWQPQTPIPDPAQCSTDFDLDHSDTGSIFSRLEAKNGAIDKRGSDFRNMVYKELALRLPELLLMRVDKITMGSSLEARVPFLDSDLVEFMLSVDPQYILQDGSTTKPLLKQVAADFLPDSILNRPKQGFGAPVADWLRGSFGDNLQERVLSTSKLTAFDPSTLEFLFNRHRKGERDYAHYLWPIINVVLWQQCWIHK